MSLASNALAKGYARRKSTAGETLTFRGASITATVDRVPFKKKEGPNPVFSPANVSRIELDSPATPVKNGDFFTDSSNREHRVQTTETMDGRTICQCHVSG